MKSFLHIKRNKNISPIKVFFDVKNCFAVSKEWIFENMCFVYRSWRFILSVLGSDQYEFRDFLI